mmetsp:Transcript_21621/g.50515  ORF Transcript_21621/g.50515 Transcript_21621/m.50515 type:complete len:169 (-) Transcript_21621:285-791(-)
MDQLQEYRARHQKRWEEAQIAAGAVEAVQGDAVTPATPRLPPRLPTAPKSLVSAVPSTEAETQHHSASPLQGRQRSLGSSGLRAVSAARASRRNAPSSAGEDGPPPGFAWPGHACNQGTDARPRTPCRSASAPRSPCGIQAFNSLLTSPWASVSSRSASPRRRSIACS